MISYLNPIGSSTYHEIRPGDMVAEKEQKLYLGWLSGY